MFCKQCGVPVDKQDQFCHNCGAQLAMLRQASFTLNQSSSIVKKMDITAIIGGIFLIVAFFMPWGNTLASVFRSSTQSIMYNINELFIALRQGNFGLGVREFLPLLFPCAVAVSSVGAGLTIFLSFIQRNSKILSILTILASLVAVIFLFIAKIDTEIAFFPSVLVGVSCLIISIAHPLKIEIKRNTLRILSFAILAIIVLAIGIYLARSCNINHTVNINNNIQSNEGGSNATVTTSSLDQEAVSIAKQFIDKRVIRCGDLTYVKTFWNWVGDRHYNRSRDKGRITVYHGNLTEADKMNGIEWSGNVEFELQGPSQTATQYNGYGEWINGAQGTSVGLMKRGGRWVTPQGYDLVDEMPKPITCEEAENPDLFKNWR